MTPIKLNDDLIFAIERIKKRLRLIVYKDGVENVCRKETLRNIERFIQSDDNHMFKGRLQLRKNVVGVGVEVKGKIVGIIKVEDFMDCIKNG